MRRGAAATVALPVALVAAIVAAVLTAAGSVSPAIAMVAGGHWIHDRAAGAAFHVDGTFAVDAKVVAPDAGAVELTLQGRDQGCLVAGDRVTVFGKADLAVAGTFAVPGGEAPAGVEIVGGPASPRRSGVPSRFGPT